MSELKAIAIIGFAFWLLFLGGCEALQRVTNGVAAGGFPVGLAQPGIVVPTPQVLVSVPSLYTNQPQSRAPNDVIVPTLTPKPSIVQPQQVSNQVRQPTPSPLPPLPTAQYPTKGLEYYVEDTGGEGVNKWCLFVPSLGRKTCAEGPIGEEEAKWIAGMMEAGLIKGDVIK